MSTPDPQPKGVSRRFVTVSALALGVSACVGGGRGQVTASPAAAPAIGEFGIDLTARDLSIRPGNDFFRHVNNGWLTSTPIPADRSRWGSFDVLGAKAEADVKTIIEETTAAGGPPGSSARKIADFFASYMDVDAIEAKGLTPIQGDLAAIAAAQTHTDVAALMARPDLPVSGPLVTYVSLDQKNPDRYISYVSHSGLGLPEREFYRRTDADAVRIQTAYKAHIGKMLTLAGQADADAKALRIYALEAAIAERHWPNARRRERDQTYNLKTKAALLALAPQFPWARALDTAGLGSRGEFVVRELDAIGPLAQLFADTPVATWREYLTYHLLRTEADVLPRAFDAEHFDFFGKTLNGQPEQRARWKRGVDAVNGSLGEAVGEIYVGRHFPATSKALMLDLVENIRRAYGQRIDALTWMSPETKVVAREKLAAFAVKIGYPDKWRDYSGLEVVRGNAVGNGRRSSVFEWNRDLARIDQPTDRTEWGMTPQTVNAYYNPTFNEIVFPAAILQAPFFDPNADPAVNYGGIGGVIGHEMGHGFDDQGAKSDARGVLRDWWNERDVTAFRALGDRLVAQYNQFEPLPGLPLNGRLGLGENIGDLGGLSVAAEAYKLHQRANGKAPVLAGTTGEQRFFMGWAQVWRSLYREAAMRRQVLVGPHSPPEFRVNAVVRNIDGWYEAFDVQATDKLYLPAEQRVRIW